MLSLFFSFSSSIIPTYFLGNWTLNTTTNDNSSLVYDSIFQISYAPTIIKTNNSEYVVYQSKALFRNITFYSFERYFYSMIGFSDPTNQTFFFFQVPYHLYRDNISYLVENKIADMFYESNSTVLCNLTDIHSYISNFFHEPNIISLNFSISDKDLEYPEPFFSPVALKGTLIHKKYFKTNFIDLDAYKFDMAKFIVEGKIFGVWSAIFFIFSLYAWISIFYVQSRTQLSQLSLTSFLMHTSFEFSYSVYLLNLSLQFEYFRYIFLLLFIAYLAMHFTLQMTLITNLWKASVDLNELHGAEIRKFFLLMFSQIILFMLLSLFSIVLVFEYPLLPLLYLYSCFIPQIYKSAVQNNRKKHDIPFTILLGLNRLGILWYFFLYPDNIAGSYSLLGAILTTIYFLLQITIIILQGKYSGAFFIPRRFRPAGFNYYTGVVQPNTECAICMNVIENNDETMVTPCHHAFHKECLTRWMQEQMICPICRAALPYNTTD